MKKTFTKQWFRAFALMALMMTTSLVANASFYLRGDYTSDGPGWSSNDKELKKHFFSEDIIDYLYIDITVESGFEFKIIDDIGTWYGCHDSERFIFSVPWSFDFLQDGNNLVFEVAGTYRVIFADGVLVAKSSITWLPCPVEVAEDIENGTVTVDKPEASAGDTVTVTVTPDYGYGASSSDVDIELTVDPGILHAPSKAPAVGEIFNPSGDAQATHDAPATYTFVMPDYPFGVKISANFQELDKYPIHNLMENSGSANHCTLTTNQPDDSAVPVGTVVTVTADVTPAEDLFVSKFIARRAINLNNVDFTDNGDGTYTFVMPDEAVLINATISAYLHGVTFDENNRWATYYGNYQLGCPDLTTAVYVVTGVENDTVLIQETHGNVIPARIGVLLYNESSEPKSNLTSLFFNDENDFEVTAGLLQGSVEDMEITSGYGLYNDTFYFCQPGTLPAHRCYLPMESVPAGAPRMLKIVRPGDGGVVTGIESVNTNDVVSVKYVNMTGVVSDKPFNGVNIVVETLSNGTTRTAKIVK